jgi:hypothetical protein
MTAPEGSTTRPWSVPVAPWARRIGGEVRTPSKTLIKINKYLERFIIAQLMPDNSLQREDLSQAPPGFRAGMNETPCSLRN